MIKRLLAAPTFGEDDEKNQKARLLHQIILANWILPVLVLFVALINPSVGRIVVLPGIILIALQILLMYLNNAGKFTLASHLFIGALFILLSYLNYSGAGEPRPLVLLAVIAIMAGGLLLGSRGAILLALLLSVQHVIIVALHAAGIIAPLSLPPTPLQNALVVSVSYMLIGLLFQLAVSRIQQTVNQIRQSELDLQASNRDLQNLSASLEKRVAERTQELEKQEQIALRRARQFEGITRVSRAISATKNLQQTLPQIAQVISEQFGFYHVGIFLSDPSNQYAILSASNSEGGKKMLARGHQLKIGEQGIVGFVTQSGRPRTALDVGADANYFDNPELPLTHSEMALPLKAEDRVIGALDIQSKEINAFSEDDVEALSTLADQVSLAIQNARLFDQSEKTLAEADAIQRQYLRETWNRLPKEEKLGGYRYSIAGALPVGEQTDEVRNQAASDKQEVNVPIILRGETIGTLAVQVPRSDHMGSDQIDLIKAVAERVALAAENARLFEETTRRAERERIISGIATKIGTSVRTESILRTTASELSQLLDGADVFIKLGSNGEAE